ncbi:MAG: transposase [Rhodobacteraceae bacterium]|nr:transposase [Paracoccaceae bacterium]
MLPPGVDDYVAMDNPVRAIDALVQTLELDTLGFEHAGAWSGSGEPPCDPAVLLKLYIYGYQNKVRSSRGLEKTTRCHVEVMRLCQGATSTYKIISDFRKNNLEALQKVNRAFVEVCRNLSLVGGTTVAIDGIFLKASAHRGTVHTKSGLTREIDRLES